MSRREPRDGLGAPAGAPSEAAAQAAQAPSATALHASSLTPKLPTFAEFDALYRENVDFVWRSLKRLGVRDAALDDATQEVFLVVHRRFHEYRAEGSPRPWLFAIAQRTASDQRRWVRRKGNLLPLEYDVPATQSSPLEAAATREAADLVLAFLDQLDEPRRVAFVLTDIEEMTGREVASATGVNSNTLYYRVVSARKAFVAFLRERGIISGEETP